MSIATNCMIVNLQIGLWVGQRLDKGASQKVTDEAGADADAARVNKHIVPKSTLAPVQAAATALRTHFYTKTLPWKDNGDRLLTRKFYAQFIEKYEELVRDFNNEVENFLQNTYLTARDQASFRMGDLFNPDDYPPAADLRRKFYVNLDIEPVAEAGDFRVKMSADQVDRIKHDLERAMVERQKRAMLDVWSRLFDTLSHYVNRVGQDGILRESVVTNLEEIVEVLPALNILNDPELEAMRQRIKESLIGYDVKDLRSDPHVRKVAATEASAIMEDMGAFMNAFAGA